jgi:hypothetical protein
MRENGRCFHALSLTKKREAVKLQPHGEFSVNGLSPWHEHLPGA